jgi:tRNA pseudouridine32 synthase/23S rRNA pseudouridine746 synthase
MKYFNSFKDDVSQISLPEKFTFPFNYSPHPLALIAARELQQYIESTIESLHEFGLENQVGGIGKMFGVLVVQNQNGELGYLSAFSGKLGMKNEYEKFVPPVYDMLLADGFYKEGEVQIYFKSEEINKIENDHNFLQWQKDLETAIAESNHQINSLKETNKLAKSIREEKRELIHQWNEEIEKTNALKELDRESAQLHYELKHLTVHWKNSIEELNLRIEKHKEVIRHAKKERKKMSIALQHRLFENYTFLNAKLESKSLHEIFPIDDGDLPPSGAGECAAPKLLHYAYANALKPICLAEFWYGKSPNSEIRKHGYFYPACKTKCFPILSHMLVGLEVDPNPLEDNPAKIAQLDIVYEDEDVILINKPFDFLSVPGRNIVDSIFTRIQILYPEVKELMVVHRLDMSTSGLILFAKKKYAHKHIQMQFLQKTIQKCYVAILDGEIELDSGCIDLPLAVDYENRPRQKVCYEYGKASQTRFEVVERRNNKTLIHFFPISGRTHQLRVHAAHQLGLNTPILGDDLYGKRDQRLFLHAEELSFIHPTTNEMMNFKVESGFNLD